MYCFCYGLFYLVGSFIPQSLNFTWKPQTLRNQMKREGVIIGTQYALCRPLLSLVLQQVPFLSTLCARPTLPLGRVRFWTWMMSCTWGACQRTRLALSSPPKYGLLCSITATWAASEICSLMARARTSDKWLKFKVLLE